MGKTSMISSVKNKLQLKKKLKNVFCDSAGIVCEKKTLRFIVCRRDFFTPEMRSFFANPKKYLAKGEVLKSCDTSDVVKVKIDNQFFVVKQYHIKSLWHILKSFVVKSRASICWRNAFLLTFCQVLTPQPIAFMEKGLGLGRKDSYYIAEYIPGLHIDDYLAAAKNEDKIKNIAAKMLDIFAKLKKWNIKHRDTKTYNFIVYHDEIYLIDLDGMRQYNKLVYKLTGSYAKTVGRFMREWPARPLVPKLFTEIMEKGLEL
jgi:hypothetical protein